jgi:hypothetical protein
VVITVIQIRVRDGRDKEREVDGRHGGKDRGHGRLVARYRETKDRKESSEIQRDDRQRKETEIQRGGLQDTKGQ